MSKPTPEADAILQRIIRRCEKVLREADQTLRDIASLKELHAGEAAWSFLEPEEEWWRKVKSSVADTLRQARAKRRE